MVYQMFRIILDAKIFSDMTSRASYFRYRDSDTMVYTSICGVGFWLQ